MNTPASAVVPSREAVEALLAQYRRNDGTESPLLTTIRALLAEVERLTSVIEIVEGDRAATYRSREELRATVADQATALAERDKDAERYRWLKNNAVRTYGIDDDSELRFRFGHVFREGVDEAIDTALAASVSTQEKPK